MMKPAPEELDRSKLLRIGELARRAGTSLRTLRYYESLGLLRPANRSQGGFRYYRVADLHRLRSIQALQQLGLDLDSIGELLPAGSEDLSHEELIGRSEQALRLQERLLEEKILELQARSRSVRKAIAKLGDCKNCGLHPSAENDFCNPCAIDGEGPPGDLEALF